jgi:hypothetical protein
MRWWEASTPHLKRPQVILKITASCNKRTTRVSTLIISSMKFLSVKGALQWASLWKDPQKIISVLQIKA